MEKGNYGYFDDKLNEYVITSPKTPTPWINYLGGGDYGGIVSNTGGGYSFDRDPRYKRILRYRYNSIPEDQPGRYIYIRDNDNQEYWSATWQPVKAAYDHYQCRHGLGYTTISHIRSEIASELTYFVPLDKKIELWWLKLRNQSQRVRHISLFSYAEFCFFDAAKDQQNVDWVQQIQQGSFENGCIFWNAFMKTWEYIFFTASIAPHSFDTSRDQFIGKYRDLANPQAVETGQCGNSIAHRGNGVGSFCHQFELAPGAEIELVYALGTSPDKNETPAMIQSLIAPASVKNLFLQLKNYWNDYLASFQVETPDTCLNLMLNTWNPYQCKTTFNWSRFVSLYQLGIDRGMGLRDSAQDILGIVHAIPVKARELLLKLIHCQFKDGHTYHLFYPLTGEGTMGEAQGGKYNWYSDDHLWLIEAVVSYLKETGDFSLLTEKVTFAESNQPATVLCHLEQSILFTKRHLGPHGIPLNGFADWNDPLNLDRGKGKAESVWTGMFFCRALNLMAELAAYLGKKAVAKGYQKLYAKIQSAINQYGWDGDWYLQAFDDEGLKVGSKTSIEEQIFLNPQSWAVLSGVADPLRAKTALKKAVELLDTDFGLVMLFPAYKEFRDDRGGISTYPPGAKENAGIFTHTNPWFIIAELLSGNNDDAYRHYSKIIPIYKNAIADRHEVEPYVYCQNILGKEHPQYGLGRNSWLTGTASWAYVAGTQYLLGIRPHYDGLWIEPHIPSDWKEFKVERYFRGIKLTISCSRSYPSGIYLNGVLLESANLVPFQKLNKETPNFIEVGISE
ncbi:MAG TPA: glycosyl transferase [Firmicutes bacterium]|nr:glycosyl transferase [Bacillota bacterium]